MSLRALAAFSGLCLGFLVGCESGAPRGGAGKPASGTTTPTAAHAGSPKSGGEAARQSYGAPLGSAPAQELAAVLREPATFAGKPLKLEGHVRRACSKMGCWMELSTAAEPNAPACRVIFQGHRFFVPKDSAGARARVEGSLELRRVEPDQVSHMEAEGGEFTQKAADGSAQEVRFIATGVELWRS
jgi:hypothetical protein